MIFGRILLHLVSLLVTELYTPTSPIPVPDFVALRKSAFGSYAPSGTIVFLYARHERNHRTRTSVSASDLPPLPAGPPARQRRFSLRSGWQTLSRFRSRSRRECAGPCASANREGNPRTGRSSDSPFESLLQRVSRAAGRKALSIIRPAACVLLQQRHGGYRGIHYAGA